MAMLLAMYQKMRLIREKNQATLDLTRFTSKYNRVSKNIERVQKMYTSKIASLESQAKMMMTQAKSIFQMQSGLSMQAGSAYLNPYQMGGGNAFITQRMQQYLSNGIPVKYVDGKIQSTDGNNLTKFDSKTQQQLLYLYQSGKLNSLTTKDDKAGELFYKDANGKDASIKEKDYVLFQQILNASNNDYYTATNYLNQANSNYETNVSIWLEAAKAQLEAEQDAAVEPLAYQQTMWELEKEQTETRLEVIKADLEKYDRLCSEETKGHAPRFGLG